MLSEGVVRIINRICDELPRGYEVSICMGDGEAYVYLSKGEQEFNDFEGGNLIEELDDALRFAKKREENK